MNKELNFETYLLITSKKFLLSVKEIQSSKNIYQQEEIFVNDVNLSELSKLDKFLSENIYKAEKKLNEFIKDIYLIIDSNEFFFLDLSIKKNNNGEVLSTNNLKHLLNEARDQCRNTLKYKKIIHIIIDNYLVDNKKFSFMPQNLKCNFFSIDISFICLSNDSLKPFEKIINKYQISVNRIISLKYIQTMFKDKNLDTIKMAKNIINGYNQNEVALVAKKSTKKGFFEKFFHFFN